MQLTLYAHAICHDVKGSRSLACWIVLRDFTEGSAIAVDLPALRALRDVTVDALTVTSISPKGWGLKGPDDVTFLPKIGVPGHRLPKTGALVVEARPLTGWFDLY